MVQITSILLLALVQKVLAQYDCEKFNSYIDTQADIDNVSQCPVLTGGIGIDSEFRGFAVIPGVKQLNSFWAGNPGASHSSPTQGPTYVSAISLPDLEIVKGSIRISGAEYLRTFQAPKLKTADGISIYSTAITSLSFPSLETLTSRSSFSGYFDFIEFPKLTSTNAISIDTTGQLDCAALWAVLKNVKSTYPDTQYSPAFRCKSALGEVSSDLTPRSSTAAAEPTTSTEAPIPEPTTSSALVAAETTSSNSLISVTAITSTASPFATSVATTLTPVSGNNTTTISSRTSSTRTSPTALPTALAANAGNELAARVWGCIGSVAAISLGLMYL